MPIYTKTGDKGETSLYGGGRVSKDECRIEAVGDVDELNSHIGFVRSLIKDKGVDGILEGVQEALFLLGSNLVMTEKGKVIDAISEKHVKDLEKIIDGLEKQLKPLKKFILPTGEEAAAALHVARSVCRRAERSVVSLAEKEKINKFIVPYLNRLSDLLFVLARYVNSQSGKEEKEWVK